MSTFDRPEIPAVGIAALLEDDDRRLLSDYGEFLPVQAEQVLIEENKPQDSLYFVISGVLHVHTLHEGKAALLARIEAGTTIGEVNVFDPSTASASVTAKTFAQVWRADREAIEQFVAAYPDAGCKLLMGILGDMSKRIRSMNEKLATAELEAALRSYWH
jgi:CRP/FNR family transcriptional regulator, cyclic AMP receptor protein